MGTVRRWYIYLVCLVSLQSLTWAVITLLQGLLLGDGDPSETAFQIAVIVIGLPVFLGHWLWAQRLAGRVADERESAVRRLYLYGTLAAFLAPSAGNGFDLIATLLALVTGGRRETGSVLEQSPTDVIVQTVVTLVVLGLLWFYHWRVVRKDGRVTPETGNSATVRRWYILGFSAAGLAVTAMAVVAILRWTMFQFGNRYTSLTDLTDGVAQLAVGLALWLIFWHWAQQLFGGPSEEERESALRKFYLYASVFVAALVAVVNATFILAGFFRRALGLSPQGELSDILPIVIAMAGVWAYHAYVLRGDAGLAQEAPRQAGLRRLYWYLVAAIGLGALLIGLSGDVSVLIRSLTEQVFGYDSRELLAWCTAALIAGLPVWLWPWRQAQAGALIPGTPGMDERRSIVRKLYLYFYLFVATMTVLTSLVYIVYRVLSLVLGATETGNLLADLARAIAFALIAAAVWGYHSLALRDDGQLNQREQAQRLAELRVAVVDGEDGRLGCAVMEGLRRDLPGLALVPIGLTPAAAQAMGQSDSAPLGQQLAEAAVIVGAWSIILTAELATAVVASPARKLLVPVHTEGWEWAALDRWNTDALVRQTVHAVKQIVVGEEVKPLRPLGAGAVVGIIVGVLVVLFFLIQLVSALASVMGF
ncbi:MAG: DUF3842 family protein [Thermoflexales bacterium]|nr:DUF3842 family protein [Thermoflexales bacterium]